MTNRIKSGIVFGVLMTICFVVQNLISYPAETSKQIIMSVGTALISGAVAGFVFGWIIGTSWFAKLIHKKERDNEH